MTENKIDNTVHHNSHGNKHEHGGHKEHLHNQTAMENARDKIHHGAKVASDKVVDISHHVAKKASHLTDKATGAATDTSGLVTILQDYIGHHGTEKHKAFHERAKKAGLTQTIETWEHSGAHSEANTDTIHKLIPESEIKKMGLETGLTEHAIITALKTQLPDSFHKSKMMERHRQ